MRRFVFCLIFAVAGALSLESTLRGDSRERAHFHEVSGLGPHQFIKLRRLNSARNDLASAQSVEIALKCGFWHFGHFACD